MPLIHWWQTDTPLFLFHHRRCKAAGGRKQKLDFLLRTPQTQLCMLPWRVFFFFFYIFFAPESSGFDVFDSTCTWGDATRLCGRGLCTPHEHSLTNSRLSHIRVPPSGSSWVPAVLPACVTWKEDRCAFKRRRFLKNMWLYMFRKRFARRQKSLRFTRRHERWAIMYCKCKISHKSLLGFYWSRMFIYNWANLIQHGRHS